MNICYLVSRAMQLWLQSKTFTLIPSEQIYKGVQNLTDSTAFIDREVMVTPCIIVDCSSAVPDDRRTGNWKAMLSVIVAMSGHDYTDADFNTACNQVFTEVFTTSIAADISGMLADFTAFKMEPRGHQMRVRAGNWESNLIMEFECCASDIT